MTRLILTPLALGLFAIPATAQVRQPPASRLATQIIGVWEGPYQSEAVPPGTLRLTVSREQDTWKATLEVMTEQPPPVGEIQKFTVTDEAATWTQIIAEMECRNTASIVDGVLKGSAECWQGGAVVVSATFLLEKKKT